MSAPLSDEPRSPVEPIDKSSWMSRHVSVSTRLAVAVLAISLVPLLVSVVLAQRSAGGSAEDLVQARLDTHGDTAANELADYMASIESGMRVLGASRTPIDAIEEFTLASAELSTLTFEELTDEETALSEYYVTEFIPALEAVRGETVDVSSFVLDDPAAVYLQAVWIAQNPFDLGEKELMTDAGDGTAWSGVHRELHPVFWTAADRLGYADLYLIEPRDHVVIYSVGKDNAFATSLDSGPYAKTALGRAVRAASDSLEPALAVEDFSAYPPALDEPTAFIATPILDNGELVGVLAAAMTSDGLSEVLTRAWREGHQGETGEIYLVGPDRRMRSLARGLAEDPDEYLDAVESSGEVEGIDLNRMAALGTSAVFQPVDTEVARRGLGGYEGTIKGENYLNEEVVTDVRQIPSEFNWILITEIWRSELEAPASELSREATVVTAVSVILVTFVAVGWANWFVRPLRRTSAALRKVSEGNTFVSVPKTGAREFRSLAASIDEMVILLGSRTRASTLAIANKVETLRSLLPPSAVARINEGSRQLVETSHEASVVAVSFAGLTAVASDLTPDRRRDIVNMFVEEADALATLNGLERVKMTGGRYFAVCGTETAHIDHTRRTLIFSSQLRDAVHRIGLDNDLPIAMSAGVDSGTVTVGLIGDSRLVYDLWGEAVDRAAMLSRASAGGEILMTKAAKERTAFTVVPVDMPELAELEVFRLAASSIDEVLP